MDTTDRRRASLFPALGFLQLPPRAPSHASSTAGSTPGPASAGLRFSMSHIGEGEWRAQFSAHPMWASAGYGVAATPWRAVQIAAWAALRTG
jgi:hypothetical protein